MEKQTKHEIIYIYDALCGWCFGFSPVMKKLYEKYNDVISFEAMSGGLMLGSRIGSINEVAPYIKTAYKSVEETTGVKFGKAFLEEILLPGEAILSSELPAAAMCVFRKYLPEETIAFAHVLQNAFYVDGIILNDASNYGNLVIPFGISADKFIKEIQSEESRFSAAQEFQTIANWGIGSYPCVLLKPSTENQHYLIAKGYTPFEHIDAIVQKVLFANE